MPFNLLVGLYQTGKRFADAFALLDARTARLPGDVPAQYQLGKTAALSGEQLDRGEAPWPTTRQRYDSIRHSRTLSHGQKRLRPR